MRRHYCPYLFDDLFAPTGGDTDGLSCRNHICLSGIANPHDRSGVLTVIALYVG